MSASTRTYTSRNVVVGYVTINVLFTLAASLIWAINTIFLIRSGHLGIFQVMIVNAVFTVGQMAFEVPTGVVADTIGRRASVLLALVTLMISTLLYVATPHWGLGIWGFIGASIILGLGFTFQTGSVDAWMVDALDATGWDKPKDRVFAWGQMASGGGMLTGSLLGGLLGQINLSLPFLARTGLLAVAFVVVAITVRDVGFTPRPLRISTFGAEARKIMQAGTRYGWRSPVIRPLLWVSGFTGLFLFFGFYAWQPYVLNLLGKNYVWLLGVVTAAFSLTGILGNFLVKRVMREGARRREAPRVLATAAVLETVVAICIGLVGIMFLKAGFLPAIIAIVLWLALGLITGVSGPVRASYINEYIPSAQRATVLSLDAFFGDTGAAVGQPVLGWVSGRISIPVAWLIGSAFLVAAPFLYRTSGAAAKRAAVKPPEA